MTEYEITRLMEQRIREIEPEGVSISQIDKKTRPELKTVLKLLPPLGLHMFLIPRAFTLDGEYHPEGVPFPVNTMDEILEAIKVRREEQNLTHYQMDGSLNLAFGYFNQIEHGRDLMSLEMFMRICNVVGFGVTVEKVPDFGPYPKDLFS